MRSLAALERSGSVGAKKVLDVLENDTKANFPEKIPGKVRFQKVWGGRWAMPLPGPPSSGGLKLSV